MLLLMRDNARLKANEAFRRHDWAMALDGYTAALALAPGPAGTTAQAAADARLLANRSVTQLMLGRRDAALQDAQAASEV